MANLLEALQQQPQMQDTTSQLATLLRAKSGKATGGPATAISSQQEQAALAQTAQDMQPVQQAAAIQQAGQQQQAREIEQRKQLQQTEIAQSRQASEMQTQLRTDQLLKDLEQGRGRIDLARYQSGLEQIGQNLRLSNREYVDNLQREGARARLNDKIQFEEQLNRSLLQDNKMLLEKQLGNKSILNVNDREFEIRMEQMGVRDAYNIFRNELKADRERQMYTGVGSLITTGIGAYGTYASNRSTGVGESNKTSPTGPYQQGYESNYSSPLSLPEFSGIQPLGPSKP